jgi:hypothetical protein
MGETYRRTRALRVAEDFGLVDVPANLEDKHCWQEPDREQRAPGDLLG